MLNNCRALHLQLQEKPINARKSSLFISKTIERKRHLLDTTVSSWFYRILPAVLHEPFSPIPSDLITNHWDSYAPNPNQTRWKPFNIPLEKDTKIDFIDVNLAFWSLFKFGRLNVGLSNFMRCWWSLFSPWCIHLNLCLQQFYGRSSLLQCRWWSADW